MAINFARVRKLHATLAPIMVLPLVLTLLSGSMYQLALVTGKAGDFNWLLDVHTGRWGSLNLEMIFPFFNALGLLTLAVTGITLWLRRRR
jgi:uncharacterized iron-regulated membrane protein